MYKILTTLVILPLWPKHAHNKNERRKKKQQKKHTLTRTLVEKKNRYVWLKMSECTQSKRVSSVFFFHSNQVSIRSMCICVRIKKTNNHQSLSTQSPSIYCAHDDNYRATGTVPHMRVGIRIFQQNRI